MPVTRATAEWFLLVTSREPSSPRQGFSPQAVDTDRRWGPLRGLPVTWMRAAGRAERRGPIVVWTKWSYMDHWVTETPQGPQPPSFNRAYMDRYVKQLSALGLHGLRHLLLLPADATPGCTASVPGFERFLQDNGFEKITGIFSAYPYATKYTAPHVRETHDRIVADCDEHAAHVRGADRRRELHRHADDDLLPDRAGHRRHDQGRGRPVEPGREADARARHEDHLPLRVLGRDPHPRAARHCSSLHRPASTSTSSATPRSTRSPASTRSSCSATTRDRCTGFHFKDTNNVDEHEAYRTPPDPELMAPEVTRWFYEMGPRAAWSTSRRS